MIDLQELEAALVDMYDATHVPHDGVHTDYYDCLNECCYKDYTRDAVAAKLINRVLDSFGVGYPRASIGSILGIKSILRTVEVMQCKHVFVEEGVPSFTSSGLKSLWRCSTCGKTEYREAAT